MYSMSSAWCLCSIMCLLHLPVCFCLTIMCMYLQLLPAKHVEPSNRGEWYAVSDTQWLAVSCITEQPQDFFFPRNGFNDLKHFWVGQSWAYVNILKGVHADYYLFVILLTQTRLWLLFFLTSPVVLTCSCLIHIGIWRGEKSDVISSLLSVWEFDHKSEWHVYDHWRLCC